jgi:hypothetical protein
VVGFQLDSISSPLGKKRNQIYICFCSSQIRTVKISNISLAASERDIREFFSFSGDIQYIEMQRSVHLNYIYITGHR